MFGHQRIGDLAWAAGDCRARGFLIGGTAGRTTLAGEGLQHQDGHSLVFANVVPNCISYDPTFMYELAVIIREGIHRMYTVQEDIYYYITVMNENYAHPAMPEGAEAGIIKGMYRLVASVSKHKHRAQLLGSGTILREVMKAAEILEHDYKVGVDVWSVTSFNELTREAVALDREHRLHPDKPAKESYVASCLGQAAGVIVAATDYIRAYADQIRAFIPSKPYTVLGTDGYGRSDQRSALRDFFEVDAKAIVYHTLATMQQAGDYPLADLLKARKALGIDPDKPNPVTV
jgi:pyruvate dehydrogenase E1 component